jgi:hypothetical protein
LSLPLTLYYVSESSEQIRQVAMSGCCQRRAEKKLGAAYQKQTAYSLRALKSSKTKLTRVYQEMGDNHLQRKRTWHRVTITDLAEINT